ncbi:3'5'-cyclic nucleotide phosphodiesterase family protein [Histomonas meleagridis]|nr:3'5'-cyclic nucleotide phosphodiesterase family protein [Histomonas meleagridis]
MRFMLKIGRGIVGICAQSGETVNIRDAYADQRFDRSVDIATGFMTRTLLCIPIYNNRGEITGVTEMINKKNDGHFDEDDEKMLMAFNVFCGISLDNARLYKASLDLTKQLRTFIQMSVAINSTISLENTLDGIMMNIQSIVNASRVTVFLNNENENNLYEYHTIGTPSTYGTVFAEETVQNRKFMLFDHHEVLGRAQTQQLNKAIEKILAAGLDADIMVFGDEDGYYIEEEEEEEYLQYEDDEFSRIYPESSKISTQHSRTMNSNNNNNNNTSSHNSTNVFDSQVTNKINADENTEVICCIPLFSSESTILGVIEFSCNWKVMGEDIKLLDCFSVFASVSIERSQLKEKSKVWRN